MQLNFLIDNKCQNRHDEVCTLTPWYFEMVKVKLNG